MNTKLRLRKKKGICLALGGGGARAMSDLGALQVLEEEGFRIAGIAGTSMGALIGALYAKYGNADKVINVLRGIDWQPAKYLLDFRWSASGVMSTHRLGKLFQILLEDAKFSDLAVPFAAVASDLSTGETVVLREGDLATAVLASIAVPSLFQPIPYKNHLLVDGGLTEPIPAPTARQLGEQLRTWCVVAVDSTLEPRYAHTVSSAFPTRLVIPHRDPANDEQEPAARAVNRWLGAQQRKQSDGKKTARHNRLWRLLFSTIRGGGAPSPFSVAIQTSIIRRRCFSEAVLRHADVVVRCHADHIGTMDFAHAGEAIQVGRHMTREILHEIDAFLRRLRRPRRKYTGLWT